MGLYEVKMHQINNYTPEEIKRMQKRAVERVRNMENIAKQTVQNSKFPSNREENIVPKETTENIEEKINQEDNKITKNIKGNKDSKHQINDFINLFTNDKERTLLIALILLLLSDNENPAIIFTLIYILL